MASITCLAKCRHNSRGFCSRQSIQIGQEGYCSYRVAPDRKQDDFWINSNEADNEYGGIKDDKVMRSQQPVGPGQ